ncbi:MAG: glycosyltransferase, partial [Lachnospiraceae bacterium]|nr:glycosyltransferase [Lachnospiraceae bacterium]
MRVLFINSVLGYGSTGRIVCDLAKEYKENGNEVKIAYGRMDSKSSLADEYGVRIGGKADVLFHALYTRITDKHGLASKRATRAFLKWAEAYNPDILWLHNVHGYYINYEMLFKWIKSRPQMQVKWTLHDCWAFTGHCSHFTYVKCDKWIDGCSKCPQLNQYPKSFTDNSKDNYLREKAAFTGVKNMT